MIEASVAAYGAVGNGIANDTDSIQKAIDTGAFTVIIPNGTYMIDALISVNPRSNQKIQMSESTVLKAIPNSSGSYAIIKLVDVSNTEILGGTLLGERDEHTGTTGEWGFGILITGNSDTVMIRDLTSKDCWGDGIYIGSSTVPAQNIVIENVICDNNRRQGMSITYAKNVIIDNSTLKNTNGANPQAGIDVEPNPNSYVENVMIKNSSFLDNNGAGISLAAGRDSYVKNVKISNCAFDNNYVELYTEGNVINSGYVV